MMKFLLFVLALISAHLTFADDGQVFVRTTNRLYEFSRRSANGSLVYEFTPGPMRCRAEISVARDWNREPADLVVTLNGDVLIGEDGVAVNSFISGTVRDLFSGFTTPVLNMNRKSYFTCIKAGPEPITENEYLDALNMLFNITGYCNGLFDCLFHGR